MNWKQNTRQVAHKYPFITDVNEFTQNTETFTDDKVFKKLTIRFDGACVPVNPNGNMGYGWAIFNDQEVVAHGWGHLYQAGKWQTSNNIAEWVSLYFGVQYLLDSEINCKQLEIIGDSMLIVNQANREWKVNKGKPYTYFANMYFSLSCMLPSKTTIKWERRDNNEYCDSLSNKFLEYGV